LGVVIG